MSSIITALDASLIGNAAELAETQPKWQPDIEVGTLADGGRLDALHAFDPPFNCIICGTSYDSSQDFLRHIREPSHKFNCESGKPWLASFHTSNPHIWSASQLVQGKIGRSAFVTERLCHCICHILEAVCMRAMLRGFRAHAPNQAIELAAL